MPINFLRSPIWGITGRLSPWQKKDAQDAKDARLEREGRVGEGEEKHVQEGHADRRELLEWGNRVTSEGWRERRGVVDVIKRVPSPLKRRTSRDFEEVFRVENEIARRRTRDEEGGMMFEKAMENARLRREREVERKRREQERHDDVWTPKDVTMRDSGIGASEDGEMTDAESSEAKMGGRYE